MGESSPSLPRIVGRYALYEELATGGMATVHLGRLVGPAGFSRTVAIKRLHAQYARDPEFVTMFLDEARLAARVQHPNVVSTLDVVATGGELFLVMELVRGEALGRLIRAASVAGLMIPPRIAAAIVSGALQGLHAAHEATGEGGAPLGIVHRDVSPQNVLVGVDGISRVLDFGVAKANHQVHNTRDGDLKGKIAYMSPQQLEGEPLDRRADIYAMGLVLYETLAAKRMFSSQDQQAAHIARIMNNDITMPSKHSRELAPFDAVVRRATLKDPTQRYQSAREMAIDVERCVGTASAHEVGEWVNGLAGDIIDERSRRIAEIESEGKLDRNQARAALSEELARSSRDSFPELPSTPSSLQRPPSIATFATVSLAQPASGAASRGGSVRTSRLRAGIFAAATLAVAGAVLGAFMWGRSHPGEQIAPAASSPWASGSMAVTAAPETANPVAPTVASSASAVVAAPPSASAVASASAVPVTSSSAPTKTAGAGRTSKPKANKPNCDNPYIVDSVGHTHFRPECL